VLVDVLDLHVETVVVAEVVAEDERVALGEAERAQWEVHRVQRARVLLGGVGRAARLGALV